MFLVLLSASLMSGIFYSCSGDKKGNQETQESGFESYVAVNNETHQGLMLPIDTNFVFKNCEILDNVYTEVYEANDQASSYEEISGMETARDVFKIMISIAYHNEDRMNSLAENQTAVCYRLVWPDGKHLDYVFPFEEVKEIASSQEWTPDNE